ncbi:hypothetical protein FALBO_16964 [Fusarium albosuccineum]|uniref:Uncharacterized protein n=1 Tax=Fusarium albosuccineum TaxID=1237068 RepID=A0A8H4KDD6_9HYPO|nr:hypothetical protein FALBO_16964 [Fusarium albosuccineum]
MADNGRSPTDIITYIGVPLAVLGVLPILYNTFATLVSLSRIKRMLQHSRLTALTRSDIVNRIIEIELPRYAVMPLDRFQDRSDYWTLSRHPSSIPGGSWTTFNWKTHSIGMKTQRVEYADQVRQPQVEVAFDELVCYLLDLGAVPNPHGWKLLRSSGLWTPVGCSLMMSPDGREDALTVATSNDSDGNLSLAVAYSVGPANQPDPGSEDGLAKAKDQGKRTDSVELDSINEQSTSQNTKGITCQIAMGGIVTALTEQNHYGNQSNFNLDSLYIDHIRINPVKSNGAWFASAATAFGTTSQTILWNYKIPDEILFFARKETVPCGVLVVLGMVDESETPEWATKHKDYGAALDQFSRRHQEQRAAMAAEALMAPAQREAAARLRMQRENEQRMNDMRDKMRLDQQRRDQRMMEALQSPKWDTKLVAEHSLRWLKGQGHWDESLTLKDVVGFMLHRMVLDGEFTSNICRILDMWKAWADVGGMRQADYQGVQDDEVGFAHATLLVAMIRDTSTALEGTVSMDLQECLRMWRKVRLG